MPGTNNEKVNSYSFTYNIEKKTMDLSSELSSAFGGMPLHYENMPSSFADRFVHEEDVEGFKQTYFDMDKGACFTTADYRIKEPAGWVRVCMFRQDFSESVVVGIVQDVSERYNRIIAETERKEKELNIRIRREREALHILRALKSSADRIISVNLTKNTYYVLNDERFVTQEVFCDGKYDDLYAEVLKGIADEHIKSYVEMFQREKLLDLYYQKEKNVYLEYLRMIDGKLQWVSSHVMYTSNPHNGEIGAIVVRRNIDDLKTRDDQQKKELTAALSQAEKANIAKSTFLFNASHDIRTPMNAVQGFARIIVENAGNEQIVADSGRKILASAEMLSTLINDVLEVSRIEQGKDVVEEQPLNMEAHIEKLYEMFASDMEKAGIEFSVSNDIAHPHILGDNLKLTRIAMNLLSNAKKFTHEGGKISFGVTESDYDGNQAIYTLVVKDNGIGMSQEFLDRAFEQFERERTSTESGVTGSGLGLAIIKKLCDLMNGECSLKSELGKGTEVTISIPLRTAQEETNGQENGMDITELAGKRILLVEDNEFNREIATYILQRAEFVVEEAEDGAVAVDKLLKAPAGYYDAVLMDIQMPVMDGYVATEEIRNIKNKEIANIPIIAMTANAFEEDKEKCLAVGMNAHLAKPLDMDKLLYTLALYIKRKK